MENVTKGSADSLLSRHSCPPRKDWFPCVPVFGGMMGSAGGVYGARRTVNRKNIKSSGLVQKGVIRRFELTERWADFEKGCFFASFLDRFLD